MDFFEGDYVGTASVPRRFSKFTVIAFVMRFFWEIRRALEAIAGRVGEVSKHLQDVVRGLIKTAQIFTSYILSGALDFEGFESRAGVDRRASKARLNFAKWGAAEIDSVLKIRRGNHNLWENGKNRYDTLTLRSA